MSGAGVGEGALLSVAVIMGCILEKKIFNKEGGGGQEPLSSRGTGLWEDLLGEGDYSLGPWSWLFRNGI